MGGGGNTSHNYDPSGKYNGMSGCCSNFTCSAINKWEGLWAGGDFFMCKPKDYGFSVGDDWFPSPHVLANLPIRKEFWSVVLPSMFVAAFTILSVLALRSLKSPSAAHAEPLLE